MRFSPPKEGGFGGRLEFGKKRSGIRVLHSYSEPLETWKLARFNIAVWQDDSQANPRADSRCKVGSISQCHLAP
jgi:hypothetical protein